MWKLLPFGKLCQRNALKYICTTQVAQVIPLMQPIVSFSCNIVVATVVAKLIVPSDWGGLWQMVWVIQSDKSCSTLSTINTHLTSLV